MVIKPEDLRKKVHEHDKDVIARLEAHIDELLEAQYSDKSKIVKFTLDFLEKDLLEAFLHERVRNELFRRYRQAGWNVKYEYDDRRGRYIEFVEKAQKKKHPYDVGW